MAIQRNKTLVLCLLISLIGQVGISKVSSQEISWGASVTGLQAGIAIENPKQSYHQGESIDFALSIRNVSENSIAFEYTEPMRRAWIPDINDSNNNTPLIMPPVLLQGGIVRNIALKPSEVLHIDKGAFTLQSFGWEGLVNKTIVFAEPGRYTLAYTLKFDSGYWPPSRQRPWSGVMTTGKIDFEVDADDSIVSYDTMKVFAKADMRQVLNLLCDYTRRYVTDQHACLEWLVRNWDTRRSSLSKEAVRYLAYFAVNYPDEEYRAVACKALGGTNKEQAVPSLLKCLSDSSAKVRGDASRALGELRAVECIPEMVKLLKDNDESVRAQTAYALGNIGSNRATKALLLAFQNEKNPNTKDAIILALGWIADPAALPVLKKALTEPNQSKTSLSGTIRNIEDTDFWGMGSKAGVSEFDLYRFLMEKIDISAAPIVQEKDKSDILKDSEKWPSAFQSPEGHVYYIPGRNVFYIQQKNSSFYYGPFEGNPHDIVRPERKALEEKLALR
jgi:hypothetical protein